MYASFIHPLLAVAIVLLVPVLPANFKKNKAFTVLFFLILGYCCLMVIFFGLGKGLQVMRQLSTGH